MADPGFEGRQGLNQEIFDSSEAFVEWCNSHGGINGRQINLTLYDAAVSDCNPGWAACENEFLMVGSGAVGQPVAGDGRRADWSRSPPSR